LRRSHGVLHEGDGNGKPHLFPNAVFQVNDKVNWNEWNDLFELDAKFGLPYFNKAINDNYALVMGCRTRLATNWTGKWQEDLLRTGNLAYVSLNLPMYALRATGRKDKRTFEEILQYNMGIAKNILIKRRLH
jgi:ribonucleoside-triphosphate reductase